tara:strand:+ start:32680 stop:33075 length:396 start_codon:yes stop_codon:yes gene_type:complete
MSSNESGSIRVEVKSRYIQEHSDPSEPRYVFAYNVSIYNDGEEAAQLLSRHWVITDAAAGIEEVRGPGVIGEQPRIQPGQSHEYQSFCVLKTPRGSMHGSFQMIRDDGQPFDAEIPAFVLATPELSSTMLN